MLWLNLILRLKIKKAVKYSLYILIIFLLPSLAFAGSQQTSQTTGQTIIDRARYYLNEQFDDFWSDEEMLVWLNDGVIDIIARSQCLQTTYDIMLTEGKLEYLIPDSTKYIGAVDAIYMSVTERYYLLQQNGYYLLQQNGGKLITGVSYGADTKGLIKGEPCDVGHGEDVGEPVRWYEWNNKIGVYPLPDASNDVVRIFLIERPDKLAMGQIYLLQQNGYYILQQNSGKIIVADNVISDIPIPAHYDYALELYVIARALYKDRKMITGGQIMKEYLEEIERFRGDFL